MFLYPRRDGIASCNIVIYIELQHLCMVDSPDPNENHSTSIIITMLTRDALKACKHGGNTYDDVIKKLIVFHHEKSGSTIVE